MPKFPPIILPLLLAAAPTTQTASTDPFAPLITRITEKASTQSVVFLIRPDTTSTIETPTAIAAIRDSVWHAFQSSPVKLFTSEEADALLRNQGSVGQPTVPSITPALAAAKADLALCAIVHRSGDQHKIAFALIGPHGTLTQLSISLPDKSLEKTGDDTEQATADINKVLTTLVGKCAEPLQTAGVKTLLFAVAPQSGSDAGTGGFENSLYDAASLAMQANQSLPAGKLHPSLKSLKDAPAESANAFLIYAHKPGGAIVTLNVVTSKGKTINSSAGIDSWDVAMMPAYPSINMKVLAYCETQRGKKVGNGECWTLAAEGLKDANAKNANGYTYGRKLTPGEKVFPGDIMQFTEAKFSGSHSDGSTWWVQLGVPNHTAVVRRVLGPSKYEILEQNPEPVTAATIDFKDLKSGTLRDLAPATEVTDWKTFQRTPQRHRHLHNF